MDYTSYGASRDVPYSMVVGRRDGDSFWAEGDVGFAAAGGSATGNGSLSFPEHNDDDAVALPHLFPARPTYDDVDPLPPSLIPPHHPYPGTNSNQGWLAPPLTPSRDSRDDATTALGHGAGSSREGSSVRGGVAPSSHRGESSRATSPRDSAGSRNGSRASVFARKLACRQS